MHLSPCLEQTQYDSNSISAYKSSIEETADLYVNNCIPSKLYIYTECKHINYTAQLSVLSELEVNF